MPLIAVCGPPRSGTTLSFQILTQAFDCLSITNLHYLFYRTPLIGYYVSKFLTRRYISDYRSHFGFISGLNGPAQAYLFWNYWCDLDLCERDPRPDPRRVSRFQKLMNAIHRRDRRPLLAGWLAHGFYMESMIELYKQCVFVRVKRDMLSDAYSLLRFLRGQDGAIGPALLSSRSREVLQEPGESAHVQVARQIYFINRRFDAQRLQHEDVIIEADYRDTCANPHGFVTRVEEFVRSRGITILRRPDAEIPESFPARVARRDDDEHTRKLAKALDELTEQYGPCR
ncbi:MAG: hypothetical protein V3T70_06180 [Phycisphaerae bacterium]